MNNDLSRSRLLRRCEGFDEADLRLAMHVVVVGTEVESDQVLVCNEQDTILLESISIILRDVTRVKQFFIIFERLANIQ